MKYLPIFYQVSNKPCLVVGAGQVAARKAELLLLAGADVLVAGSAVFKGGSVQNPEIYGQNIRSRTGNRKKKCRICQQNSG